MPVDDFNTYNLKLNEVIDTDTQYPASFSEVSSPALNTDVPDYIFTNIELSGDLSVSMMRYCGNKPLKISYEMNKRLITFNFIISGSCGVTISGNDLPFNEFNIGTSTSSVKLHYGSLVHGDLIIPANANYMSVGVQTSINYIKEIMKNDLSGLPEMFSADETTAKLAHYKRFTSILTPEMIAASLLILKNTDESPASRHLLYLKCSELICLKLLQMKKQEGLKTNITLSRTDKLKMYKARDILIRNPSTAIPIKELARLIGINTLKLQKGFKEEFGTTIHNYYNQYRMSVAMEMLKDGDKNVTETATYVGYSNVSHFIEAFKRVHGITPGKIHNRL